MNSFQAVIKFYCARRRFGFWRKQNIFPCTEKLLDDEVGRPLLNETLLYNFQTVALWFNFDILQKKVLSCLFFAFSNILIFKNNIPAILQNVSPQSCSKRIAAVVIQRLLYVIKYFKKLTMVNVNCVFIHPPRL